MKALAALFVALIGFNLVIFAVRSHAQQPVPPAASVRPVRLAPVPRPSDRERLQRLEVRAEMQQEMIDYHQELLEQRCQQQCDQPCDEPESFVKRVTPF